MNPNPKDTKIINYDAPEAERGMNNSKLYDPANNVHFNDAPCEMVISNRSTNTWIVLGRDRPGGWESGYGALGVPKAGAIDIVVGRLSSIDMSNATFLANPSFGSDAARVYISQKTNVDDNFNIPVTNATPPAKERSAVAIKADAVRLIARESLKLVTRTDALLSNGAEALGAPGIELITNDGIGEIKLQPIPRGLALVYAFEQLVAHILELNGQLEQYIKLQDEFNNKISNHTHYSPFYAQETSFDPKLAIEKKKMHLQEFSTVLQGLIFNQNNFVSWAGTFLNPGDENYINSKYHKLN